LAAEASECAGEQGRFWDYYDKIFKEQAGENVGAFSKENLKRFAEDLKLDREQFDRCLDTGKYTEKVQQETALGQQDGVRSTPALFVNGLLIEGGMEYEILKAAIDAELSK